MPEAQASLSEFFTHDHRSCDGNWADVEAAVESGRAEDIAAAWQRFDGSMRRHLQMEEEVLFPAFEEVTGMRDAGPTFIMRSEHAQMRGLLDQMGAAAGSGAWEDLVDLGDTLLMLIQQHNAKEEQMLYPMSERALSPHWADLRRQLEPYLEAN